ncbi:MAG TPA: hypothetical protein VNF02_06550 [Candidatus Limnocylindrales bacterium]|nr:hypothetical protein [Candidatus Limnocylindrales bacterium]
MMGEVTHEQVNLMLHLYEIRREPLMREARAWFIANFHPQTPEDVMKICPPGTKENAYLRMVASYWEMVANIVNRGLIDEEFFFENSGEQWVVWECVKPIVAGWRARVNNPHVWKKLEEHCARFEAWREKRAPGHSDTIRQMIAQTLAKKSPAKSAASKSAKKTR